MPVPRARRSIALAPVPDVRRTAALTPTAAGVGLEAARADVGRAISAVGGEVADIGTRAYGMNLQYRAREIQEARQRADQIAVIEYENGLAAWERDALYDPNSGALTKKGKTAFDLPETIDSEFTQAAATLGSRLSTDAQRMAAARITAERGLRIGLTVRRHVHEQIQTYTAETLQARIDNAIDSAQRNALSPNLIPGDIARADAAIDELGSYLGFSPEQLEKGKRAMHSAIHEGVIDQLITSGEVPAAQAWFKESQGEIAATKLDDIRARLRGASVEQEAFEQGEKILATHDTLSEQREAAKAIKDSDVRTATLRYIEHEAAVRKAEQQQAAEDASKSLYDTLEATGGNLKAIVNTKAWHDQGGIERNRLRDYAETLAGKGPGAQQTDQKTWYNLLNLATGTPEQRATFRDLNLYDLAKAKLSNSDFQQVAGWQKSMREGNETKTEDQLGQIYTQNQLLDSALEGLGFLTQEDKASDPATQFKRRAMKVIEEEQRHRQRRLTSAETQATIDRLILNVQQGTGPAEAIDLGTLLYRGPGYAMGTAVGRMWRGLTTPAPKRGFEVTAEEIPEDHRRAIAEQLRKAGQPVTPEAMVDQYLRGVQKQK